MMRVLAFLISDAEFDEGIAFEMSATALPSERSRIEPIESETTISIMVNAFMFDFRFKKCLIILPG